MDSNSPDPSSVADAYMTRLADTARCLPPEHVELAEDITHALAAINRLRAEKAVLCEENDALYEQGDRFAGSSEGWWAAREDIKAKRVPVLGAPTSVTGRG